MKYYATSDERLKELFGKYSHLSGNGQELTIVRSGSNIGEHGRPNLDFILPFPGVPLTREGQLFDIGSGFKIPELAKEFYTGFDETTIIIPGTKIRRHPTTSRKKQFLTTFDPDKTEIVLIGRKCDQNTDQLTRDELRELAVFASLGKPKEGEASGVFWDYYVLSVMTDYNHVAGRNDILLSDAKYAASGERSLKRRTLLREYLEKIFGELDNLTRLTPRSSKKKPASEKAEVITEAAGKFGGWHYVDELYHSEIWVIDQMGRLLEPDSAINHGDFDQKYASGEISMDEFWEKVPESAMVIRYSRRSFAEPAQYVFLQKPAKVSEAQLDRLTLIENNLRNEVREAVGRYNLFERLARRGPENSWTLQLHDETVIAEALKK